LAEHFVRAREVPRAVQYLRYAGETALQRSAYHEASAHLTHGLEWLVRLPDTPERAQQELSLQTTLAGVLMMTRGYGTPEVEHALLRAQALCHRIADTSLRFSIQAGLQTVALARAELQTARTRSEELLAITWRQQDPLLDARAYIAAGEACLFLGELGAARAYLERGIACDNPQQHDDLDLRHVGAAVGVVGRATLAWTLWLLGYPEQARASVHGARALAQQLSHPASLVYALDFAVGLHQLRREVQAVQERTEELKTLARAQALPFWIAWGTVLQGWAGAVQERSTTQIAQMWEGLAACRATGFELNRPWLLALIAEAYNQTGQAGAGLTVLAEALALVDNTSERWYEAELYRLKGELLLGQAGTQHRMDEAEGCFLRALGIASRQRARSWELRTAMSLSRLWQQQGKQADAYQMLAKIYSWFSEGFDTADLQEARALLEALRGDGTHQRAATPRSKALWQ
jgi:predicted ATPase